METSLHRQLKAIYAESAEQTEVRLGHYRIDVVRGEELIEIQHGSLAAIRGKIKSLLTQHRVRVVKPIVISKQLIKRAGWGRRIVDRRMSPKRGTVWELFHDLVYFSRVFPHPNLVLEVPLVDVEEWRYPGHGRRRWRRQRDHQVEDQKLLQIAAVHCFQTAHDLARLLPSDLPVPFHTRHLAQAVQNRTLVCPTHCLLPARDGAIRGVGKSGNLLLYELPYADPPFAANHGWDRPARMARSSDPCHPWF